MKRTLLATGMAVACAVSLAAQTPASQDKPQEKAGQSAAADKSVTMKGCLREGSSPGTFELANAAPAASATGTTGSAASAKAETVRLVGAPAGMTLKDHVGHTVEITGMLTAQGAKSGTTAGTTGKETTSASAGTTQQLNVKSMKHVDAKCGS